MTMETIDRKTWRELLSEAMRGKPEAQWEAGYYHEHGAAEGEARVIIRKDAQKALQWYRLAAEQGYGPAQHALAIMLSEGGEVPRDLDAAIYWSRKAMSQGDAAAAFNLGTIYRDLQKPAKAFRAYSAAAAMGDKDAHLTLALCHLFGYGTRKSPAEAFHHLHTLLEEDPTLSSPRSREHALYWLALLNLLEVGGLKRSFKRARILLEAANADDDHELASDLLNLLGRNSYNPKTP